MREIRRIILACFLVFIIILASFAAVPTVDNSTYVHDLHDYLTTEQKESLEEYSCMLKEKYGVPVVVVVTGNAEGKSSKAYAEDFYEYNNFAQTNDHSGIILVIDMDNRNVDIRAYGEFGDHLLGSPMDSLLDNTAEPMKESGNIHGAGTAFLQSVEKHLGKWESVAATVPPSDALVGEERKHTQSGVAAVAPIVNANNVKGTRFLDNIKSSLVIGFVISGIIMIIIVSVQKDKTSKVVHAQRYLIEPKARMRSKDDRLVNSRTYTRIIQRDSSSGGGSSGSSRSGGSSSFGSSRSGGSSSSGSSRSGGSRGF